MKILISGLRGFLGKNLLNHFKAHEIYGIGREDTYFQGIKVYNHNTIDKIPVIPDIIILCHAAVESGTTKISNELLFSANVNLTEKLCLKFKTSFIIHISSVSVYSYSNQVIFENSELHPQSDYAFSKLWGEHIVKQNPHHCIIRLSSIYGEGMKENTLIPNYINQALKNHQIEVWGEGNRKQNYIHINDVIQYLNKIIFSQKESENQYLLGVAPQEYSNLEIAEIISEITTSKIIHLNKDNSHSFIYNNDFTTNLLKFKPQIDIKRGIENYILWKKSF